MFLWRQIEPGAEQAVLYGDPAKPGDQFILRYRTHRPIDVPPHWHPVDEHITVIAGVYELAMGDEFNTSALQRYGPGDYIHLPARAPHFARYSEGTVVQVNGIGVFETIYIEAR